MKKTNAGELLCRIVILLSVIGTCLILAVYLFIFESVSTSSAAVKVMVSDNTSMVGMFLAILADGKDGADLPAGSIVLISMIVKILEFLFLMLILYAFGELCVNVYEMNHANGVKYYDEYERFKESQAGTAAMSPVIKPVETADNTQRVWVCPNCKNTNMITSQNCISCGFRK